MNLLIALRQSGVDALLKLAEHTGLTDAIDSRLQLLKCHAPYRESDQRPQCVAHVFGQERRQVPSVAA
jgi:hypothetical protein